MALPEPTDLREPPADRVRELAELLGAAEVVRWCAEVLSGRTPFDDPQAPSLSWLGGAHAAAELARGELVARGVDYWPRVWAARGLLHVWCPSGAIVAGPALVSALGDEAWRVREMAAKVIRRREIGVAADRLADLVSDPVPRVRAAAVRGLAVTGEFEHAAALRRALEDPDGTVRKAAGDALERLSARLDRSLSED